MFNYVQYDFIIINYRLNTGDIQCTLDHSRKPRTGRVTMEIEWGAEYTRTHSSSDTVQFTILPTPSVRQLTRTRVFVSGGVNIGVWAEHGTSIKRALGLWYREGGDVTNPVAVEVNDFISYYKYYV